MLCPAGAEIKAHEFHYWDTPERGCLFNAAKPRSERNWNCMRVRNNCVAGFPHLYFLSAPEFAASFVGAAAKFGGKLL
jgi:cobyrinic acid a,c-diamide synthase